MRVQSRYPYEQSEMNLPHFNKFSWPFDELSDNNESDNGLSLAANVAINEQILGVIFTLGNDATLMHGIPN